MHPARKQQIEVTIRWMIRRDMPEVLKIEAASFEYTWDEDEFLNLLRPRNCIGMVAEHENRVVGFMIYEMQNTRLHILNFAVDPEFRKAGVGSQMIHKLTCKLRQQHRREITLEVRETNLPAQKFFQAMGFLATGVLREFYDTGEDAYAMVYRLPTAETALKKIS